MKKAMIKALIFDFDGLILETEAPVLQSWQELYQRYGCEILVDDWLKIVGTAQSLIDPAGDLERIIGRGIDRDAELPRRLQRELELISEQTVLPGVVEYLQSAKKLGLKIGLASSSSCAWVTGHLGRLGLTEHFDVIVAADDVSRAKPDPELYLTACKRLGVRPNEALALEDSLNGLLAAKRAGMFCAVVPNELTRRLGLDAADVQLASLAEVSLEALLERLNGRTPA